VQRLAAERAEHRAERLPASDLDVLAVRAAAVQADAEAGAFDQLFERVGDRLGCGDDLLRGAPEM
jgi:hypothetical protein